MPYEGRLAGARVIGGGTCSLSIPLPLPLPRGMVIRFDPRKRLSTIEQRGLDFIDADSVFAASTIEIPDRRRDYGELSTFCFGLLRGRAANEREQRRFLPHLC